MSAANANPEQILWQKGTRVLRALRERSMDGYMLMKKTGLSEGELSAVVERLASNGLVEISGNISAQEIGRSRIWIPADTVGKVDSLISQPPLNVRAF